MVRTQDFHFCNRGSNPLGITKLKLGLWRNWLSQRTHNPQIAGSSPAGPTMEDNMNSNKQKLEQMIDVAKLVLKHNPDDTWVRKGLVAMEEELERINKDHSDKRRTNIGD